ncbi:MAG TPA: response regulator [Thermodesulfobacteriaceae bacterium]|nr:response regulator [Thermodesulfobacteriaceae bacterium]
MQTGQLAEHSGIEEKTRVFIIDDSPMMCRVMEKILTDDPSIEVTGHALSGKEALMSLPSTKCDVCTLDVHMPGMNGISVLKHIMIKFPRPTLMVSAFTADGSKITFESLRYGAVDFFQKPSHKVGEDLMAQAHILRERVKRAARVQVGAARYLRLKPVFSKVSVPAAESSGAFPNGLVILNSSTGGYSALLSLLPGMTTPPEVPIVVSLGTPISYLDAFVNYLNGFVPFEVMRGKNNDKLISGRVYVISAQESAALEQRGDSLCLLLGERQDLSDDEGALDLLLFSASELFGPDALAVFLSGDEAKGLSGAKEVLRNGGKLIVQESSTCLSSEFPDKVVTHVDATSRSIGEISKILSNWTGE